MNKHMQNNMRPAQLQSAVEAGIISADTAQALQAHFAQSAMVEVTTNAVTTNPDEEQFRLVTGFNDIFVVIASALLLIAVGWLGASLHNIVAGLAVSVTAWGLSEYFVRKRRMALPAIVLLLAFAGGIYQGLYAFFMHLLDIGKLGFEESWMFAMPALGTSVAAWLHWKRFNVPITVAVGAVALASMALTMVPTPYVTPLVFVAGLMMFAWALRWDAQDTLRQTRHTDIAFWLHLAAAPMMVHPIFSALNVLNGEVNLTQASIVLVLYVLMGLISLVIDRRSLMVSALGYVLYTFTKLINQGQNIETGFAFTALIIGASLLILSAYWHPLRRRVLRLLPAPLKPYLPA